MFLSKLILNARDRQARHDLARPYEMHRTLWRAFPENDPGRILFRVDPDRTGEPDGPPTSVAAELRSLAWGVCCILSPASITSCSGSEAAEIDEVATSERPACCKRPPVTRPPR